MKLPAGPFCGVKKDRSYNQKTQSSNSVTAAAQTWKCLLSAFLFKTEHDDTALLSHICKDKINL